MAEEPGPYGRNDEMGRIGKTLVAQLFILFKTSLNYSRGHSAIDAPVANVLKVVREIARRREAASLKVKSGVFYLGELRLKSDSASFEAGRFVMEEMKRHLLGGISFHPEAAAADLSGFVNVLREVDALGSTDSYGKILELMQQRSIVNIEVETLPEEAETAEIDKEKQRRLNPGRLTARLLYKKALNVMEEAMVLAGAGQTLRLRGSKRVMQRMIDLLPSHEASLLGLTAAPDREADTQNHAVNVCILCLVLGRRLGMSKFHLCELGMAALFHDIGKADVARAILDKTGELSPQELQTLEAHPVYGVKKLMMKFKALDVVSSRIVTGIFEHHLLADFSGYPLFRYNRLSLLGRIISIADCYEELTCSRPGGRRACPPDKALRFMLTRAGKEYDRGLLKLFIKCVGVHGVGSLLLLDNKELAVVVENRPAQPDNPRIRIIADSQGRELDGEVVDLAQPGSTRSIVSVLDPHPYNLDVGRYFI